MATSNAPKANPYNFRSYRAEGALAIGFLMIGTTDDELKQITTGGNVAAVGHTDVAVLDNDMLSAMAGAGSTVDCIAEGTVTQGELLVTGNGVNTVKSAPTTGANNIVGRALNTATVGLLVQVDLMFTRDNV